VSTDVPAIFSPSCVAGVDACDVSNQVQGNLGSRWSVRGMVCIVLRLVAMRRGLL
jgi:hypothetical protein